VYVLVDTSEPSPTRNLPHFQPQLSDLTFIPSGAGTTTFNLTIVDSDNEHQTDSTTTVTASGAGSTTTPTISGTTTATPTATSNELTPTSGGTLIDAAGNKWTLTSAGAVDENGAAVPGGSNTSAFAIVGNMLYGQDGGSKSWFTYSPTNQYWASSAAPTLSSSPLAHAVT
jgi:hypothetical protein